MHLNFSIPISENYTTAAPDIKKAIRHIGDLEITAIVIPGNDDDVDYRSIKWNGVDILPLLDNISGGDDILQFIYSATIEHARYQLENAVDHE